LGLNLLSKYVKVHRVCNILDEIKPVTLTLWMKSTEQNL